MFQLTTPLTPAPGRAGNVVAPGAGGGKGAVAIPDFLSFALPVAPEGASGNARQDPAGGGEAVPGGIALVPPAGHPDAIDSVIAVAGSDTAVPIGLATARTPANVNPKTSLKTAEHTLPMVDANADAAVTGIAASIMADPDTATQIGVATRGAPHILYPDALSKAVGERDTKSARALHKQDGSPVLRGSKVSIAKTVVAALVDRRSDTKGPATAAPEAQSTEEASAKNDVAPGDGATGALSLPVAQVPTEPLPPVMAAAATEDVAADPPVDRRGDATAPVGAARPARSAKEAPFSGAVVNTTPAPPLTGPPAAARAARTSIEVPAPRTVKNGIADIASADARGRNTNIAPAVLRDTAGDMDVLAATPVPTTPAIGLPVDALRIPTDPVATAPHARRADPAILSLGAVARMLVGADTTPTSATPAAAATPVANPASATAPRVAALPAMPASVATFLASVGPRPVAVPLSDAKPPAEQRSPVLAAAASAKTAPPVPVPPVTIQPAGQMFAEAIHAATGRAERARSAPGEADAPGLTGTIAIPTASAAAATAVDRAPLDMAQAHWPMKMIERIEVLRDAADAQDTRIKLIPDALGAIDISLKREGETVRVHLAAERPETRAMIADAQPRLAELGEQRGLRIAASSGQAQGQMGGHAAAQDSHPQRGNPAPQQPARPASASAGTSPADEDDGGQRLA